MGGWLRMGPDSSPCLQNPTIARFKMDASDPAELSAAKQALEGRQTIDRAKGIS